MRDPKKLTPARRALAVAIFAIVALVDIAGDADTNPPPEPVRIGREAWEL